MRRFFIFFFIFLPIFSLYPGKAAFAAGNDIPAGEKSISRLGVELTERYKDRTPQRWGERLPGVVARLDAALPAASANTRTVALTLDACDASTDRRIIALLREHAVPATVFITNRWLRHNPALARDLDADPLFMLACHGARHQPASVAGRSAYGIAGTRNITALVYEVEANARSVAAVTGKRPRWYRSGTAHYDDVALMVIADLGLSAAGYTFSADAGASLPAVVVARRMAAAKNGDIILCHLNRPESGTYHGLAEAVPAMLKNGVKFVLLPE